MIDDITKLRIEFESRIADPDMVEHEACGGFEYQHIVADVFEDYLRTALKEAEKKRDKECKESGHIILRGDAAMRMYEVLKEDGSNR